MMTKRIAAWVLALVLVMTIMVPAGAMAATRTLKMGDSGDDVKVIQTFLLATGYYNGDVTGEFDLATATAVKSFQRVNRLQVDGKVGTRTLAKMQSGNVVDVKAVQSTLQTLGYYDGAIDGNFGALSVSAVKALQKVNKLTANGVLNDATLKLLEGGQALPKPADTVVGGTLSSGATGEAVRILQQDLKDTYYYYGNVDGIFGAGLGDALRAFQASTGLTVDGKYGPASYNALHNRAASIFNGGIPRRTLSSGDHGWDVYVLQQKLSSMNYSVTPNGHYDAATVAAVKKLQARNGLKEDGKVGSDVRRYIWPTQVDQQEQDQIKEELKNDKDAYSTEYGRILKLGSHGNDVANAQMRLKAGNYLYGKADGIFGVETQTAVIKFQKALGLAKTDGIIGEETWAELRKIDITNAEQEVVDPGKPSIGTNSRKLYRGCSGTDVKRLQQQLIELGYLSAGEDDGKFGIITYNALVQFQMAYGLTPDGVAGTQTFNKLNELTGAQG